ncbi:VPA1262 family protein [Pseudomonas sp. XS1P51]
MAHTLGTLLNDERLMRLFSKEARDCALQLWILQIKSGQSIENRVVYGRLLPYSHSTDRWSASDDNKFQTSGDVHTQVVRLNLYVKSSRCVELLQQLCSGRTISQISEELTLVLSKPLKVRFGDTALNIDGLVYRPVAYLLNRDAHERKSLSSPHGGAGAFSASITQSEKTALFRLGQDYDVDLTASVVSSINSDTGLDFGGVDQTRFGDLELLVFPALDDLERQLLSVDWIGSSSAFVVRFNPMQVSHFVGFQFHLKIENDGHVVFSGIATAKRNEDGEFECKFPLNTQLRSSTDSTELEVFGFQGEHALEGTLCCRWRIGYVREISTQMHVVGHGVSPVKFDWLEKTTRPLALPRVKAALTIKRGNAGFDSLVGGREGDPWVPVNRELASLLRRLHPSKSEGRFFQRWGQGDGEGRLQLVEWFKALLSKYPKHQLIVFDPYFEDAGLGLLLLCAMPNTSYVIFTSLVKPSKKSGKATRETDSFTPDRINNLLASCEHNQQLLKSINLRIYALKEGRLHDRYILIVGPDRLPVAGFHLSNSLQKAAENYPLLITPIPADVLLKVERYKSGLVQEAWALQSEDGAENPHMRLIFDTLALPTVRQSYEPLRFLDKAQAGNVLSLWTGESSLKGLSGDLLKEQMTELSMLVGDSLRLPEFAGFRTYLDQKMGSLAGLSVDWDVLGDVIAYSRSENYDAYEFESKDDFLDSLMHFLDASFNRIHQGGGRELSIMDAQLFQRPVEALLHSSYHPYHLSQPIKYAALTWAEYFAIKFLWKYSSDALLSSIEAHMANVPLEPEISDAVRLSLLSQVVSEISLSTQFDISAGQRDRLLRSSNGLLQWIGLNAIEQQLDAPNGLTIVLQLVAGFPYMKQVQALGWMVNRAASKAETGEIYKGLLSALHGVLPTTIPASELKFLVDSMRGHMREIAWAEPWLSQEVVFPLLRNDRVDTDDACEIWIQELVASLKGEQQVRLFVREREGRTTNVAAFLFAHSGPMRQKTSLEIFKAIIRRQQRVVQQPLASTSNWTRWNDALMISMWLLTFSRWSQYYLRDIGRVNVELEDLVLITQRLVLVRPMGEWRSEGASNQSELAAFLDQVEGLLESGKEK